MGLLLTASFFAAFPISALAGSLIPLSGSETGYFTSDLIPFNFPFATDGTTGEGEATGIGHYTLSGTFVANVILGLAEGTFTLTADDGDKLFLDVKGGVIPADHSQVLWNNTITGGTGAFDQATGSFTSLLQLEGVVGSKSPNPYVATLSGTISKVPDDGPISSALLLCGMTVTFSILRRRSAGSNVVA